MHFVFYRFQEIFTFFVMCVIQALLRDKLRGEAKTLTLTWPKQLDIFYREATVISEKNKIPKTPLLPAAESPRFQLENLSHPSCQPPIHSVFNQCSSFIRFHSQSAPFTTAVPRLSVKPQKKTRRRSWRQWPPSQEINIVSLHSGLAWTRVPVNHVQHHVQHTWIVTVGSKCFLSINPSLTDF